MVLRSLNHSNEIVAFLSAGYSLNRIVAPLLSAVLLVSVMNFFVGDHLLPLTADKKNFVKYVKLKKRPQKYFTLKNSNIWYKLDPYLINIDSVDAKKQKAYGMALYELSEDWNLKKVIVAESALLKPGSWELFSGSTLQISEDHQISSTSFQIKLIGFKQDILDLQDSSRPSELMSLKELKKYIKKNKSAGRDMSSYEVDYHSKWSMSLAALILCLLAIPLSLGSRRSGSSGGVLGCLLLGVAYWLIYNVFLNLGGSNDMPAFWAAWIPNLAFLFWGVWRLKRFCYRV